MVRWVQSSVIKRKIERIDPGRQELNLNGSNLHLFFFFREVLHSNYFLVFKMYLKRNDFKR